MRKALFNAAGWLLPVLVALIATPWLIRELGAARYGVWALTVMLGGLIPTLDFGFGVAAVRDLARARNDSHVIERVCGELLSLAVVLGAFAWGMIVLGGSAITNALNFDQAVPADEAGQLMHLLGPWVAVAFLNGALSALPRAQEHFGALALVGSASSLALWIGATVLASLGTSLPSIMGFGLALQIMVCASLVVLHWSIAKHWPMPVASFAALGASWRFALASFTGSLSSLATYHADKALVSIFIGPAAAGLYTASSNVANKLLGLVASLAGVIYPRVSMLHADGTDRLQVTRLYFVSSRSLMTLTCALAVVGTTLSERFIDLWLGANATPELILTFRLLILAYALTSTSVVASNVLSGRGNARRGAWFATLGGVMTVLAGLVLIPRFGLVGAGWAGVIGMSQAVVFDLWLAHELRSEHKKYASTLRRPWAGWFVAGLTSSLIAWAVQTVFSGWLGLMTAGGLGVLAFAATWFGAGFAAHEERQVAMRAFRFLKNATHGRKRV